MRRVQVESPFAPRTPLPEGTHCYRLERGGKRACFETQEPSWEWCVWCEAVKKRGEESARHARYLAACLRDCIRRGETPYASHGLLTLPGVLRDDVPEERELGIRAGFVMREAMHATVFYTDLGWSRGMRAGEEHAMKMAAQRDQHVYVGMGDFRFRHAVVYRTLGPDWDK